MDDREPRRQPLDTDAFARRHSRTDQDARDARENRDEREGGGRGRDDRAGGRALTERERRERWPLG